LRFVAAGRKKQQASTDLVKRAETMPASQESVGVPEPAAQRLQKAYNEAVLKSRKQHESDSKGASVAQFASAAVIGGALLVATPWVALPLGMFMALSGVSAAHDAKKALDTANDKSTELQQEFMRTLRREFIDAQRKAYSEKQDRLVEMAEAHLAKGGLLDETALSYLAAIPPSKLQGASDQLAISVLQIRSMLDYIRSRRIDLDGERGVPKPACFADFKLSPRQPEHRPILRAKLEENRFRIAEDEGPQFAEPQIVMPESQRQSGREKFARYLGAAFFIKGDRERAASFEMPSLAPVEVPALRQVESLGKIIGNYERAHGRLDLPALRGWGGREPKPLAYKPL
jgi:hypothetical protein